jgi:hypothetical protein
VRLDAPAQRVLTSIKVNLFEDKMKNALTIVLSILLLTQSSCDLHPVATQGKSRGPDNSKPTVGRIENGQTVRWEKQGITFTVPPDWRKDDYPSQEDQKLNDNFSLSGLAWKGPRDQKIEFILRTGEIDFPVSEREMLEADYKTNQSQKDRIKESHYEEIGGLNGIFSVVASDQERIEAWWITYRHRNGKAQSVGVNLRGKQNEMDLLMTILKSITLEHDKN